MQWSETENTCPLCKKRFSKIEKIALGAVAAAPASKGKGKRKRKGCGAETVTVKRRSQSQDTGAGGPAGSDYSHFMGEHARCLL